MPFLLPSEEEKQKIAAFLTAVDEKIQQLAKKKELLERYKKGVMQKIFNQEIRFKDSDGNDFADWEEKPLGEIGSFKNGLNKGKEDFGFGYPFINLMDVFGKPSIVDDGFSLVNANKKELEAYNLLKGDVLFIRSSVKKTGVGETSVVLEDIKDTVYSGFLIRFREFSGTLNLLFKKYCFHARTFRNNLVSLSTTSANTNINQESLSGLMLTFPCMEEQKKIADFLSAIDDKINLVNRQLEKTKEYKKSLLQKMFV
jgi:type I restriction enzyme S subunit